MKYKIQS